MKLEKAVSDVLTNQLSIRKAAEQYGIPVPLSMTMCLANCNLVQLVDPNPILEQNLM